MAFDPWHYPRTDFSNDVHAALHTDQVKGIRLFGPRRTGKTQFLLRDLARRAEQYGNRFAYVSFWQSNDPFELMRYELDQSRTHDGRMTRMSTWLNKSKKEAQIGVTAGPATAAVTMTGADPAVYVQKEQELARIMDELKNNTTPLLLFLDEFQALASHPNGGDFLQKLYALLDGRQRGIKAVFSGSSQIELNRVFSTTGNAPFGGFGTPVFLPELTDDFVTFQCKAFEDTYGRALPRDAALDVFETFDKNPEIFRSWVVQSGIMRHATPDEVVEHIFTDFDNQFGFTDVFAQTRAKNAKTRLRRQVFLRILAEKTLQPTGDAGLARFSEITGAPPPTKDQLKSVMKDLKRSGLVDQEDGRNVIADPIFARWINRLPLSQFRR
ncbi:MAG: ATP-binding protein [Pseudomonadota bacterium]